ncbi:undecaprenyl/decaprenyl-phosphate alpha-N-acetylglucosaminyl 1-phosphate transferase [Candidatus Peregrinibacteria bacterium]|jgi:UDP-GlcNAc:undecaprenyl-phosphate/decaprenyl-phosphate GlcNAc-1-phosphate transferase|nr:undecaprenyl/decaprenyl-phosphate alpha-N-acetylglucosaminyl 1-phosphate transferase [Candidatus Peregrinibacteria bacterium]MBT4632114.1 undecaprenyl/decaprenyl-phosphate alpha-N-acetylglucosaminyl 1-phosphate transferase [Candidatus Peregrinibacteria bacterium]
MFLSPLLTSFGLTALFAYLVLRFFPKLGLVDNPKRYGHQRSAIPYPGGIAIFGAVVISLMIFLPLDPSLRAVISGATLLAITSFADDRRGLSPFFRLGIQFIAAVLLVLGGIGINSLSNPFGDPIILDSMNLPFSLGSFTFVLTVFADLVTIVWVMAMINAFNWIDGIPGMSSSIAAVSSLILLVLSTRPDFHFIDQTLAITLSSIILGASLAFLFFDFPPAKMLIGDTGSMLLGFLLAVTAIISGGKIATTILVLGFPILDFAWVIGRRMWQGKSPFKGDLWHFHHRFLKAGFSERRIVLFFVAASAVFGSLSLSLHTEGKVWALFGIISVMVLLAATLYSKK